MPDKIIIPRIWNRVTSAFAYRRGFPLVILALLIILWLAPVPGEVLWVPDNWRSTGVWPRVRIEPAFPQPGESARAIVTDVVPWTNVRLAIVEAEVEFERYEENTSAGTRSWFWSFTVPSQSNYQLAFYHDCDSGCVEWTKVAIGPAVPEEHPQPDSILPTKLGVVFANPVRDWHNRSGWDVELTYARLAETEYWGVDDLARRVRAVSARGLRVLVRVDYDQGQSLPPANDYLALDEYLKYCQRLARDARLREVYGFIIGSGFNASGSNSKAPASQVTPEWYARVFNGYGAEPAHAENVVEVMRAGNPTVRVLAGPVRPWISDQEGQIQYRRDVPWLNYMNTLVEALGASAQANQAIGVPLVSPDGFAVQAPGRPDAPELASHDGADEPRIDLRRSAWYGARAGFRVYRDWLDIINANPHTRGLPVYITSTNTYQPDTGTPPAQNYPPGWLGTALDVINQEPQVQALVWFLDEFPYDTQWEMFSLTDPRGLLVDAADEFDRLLRSQP